MKKSEKDYLRSVFAREYKEYLRCNLPVVTDSKLALEYTSRVAMLLDILNGLDVKYDDIVYNEQH